MARDGWVRFGNSFSSGLLLKIVLKKVKVTKKDDSSSIGWDFFCLLFLFLANILKIQELLEMLDLFGSS